MAFKGSRWTSQMDLGWVGMTHSSIVREGRDFKVDFKGDIKLDYSGDIK